MISTIGGEIVRMSACLTTTVKDSEARCACWEGLVFNRSWIGLSGSFEFDSYGVLC